MANKNLFTFKDVRNKPNRNGFDLSQKNSFTAKVGELLPVYHKIAIPGDKFNFKVQHVTRTQPVNTAAFTRIREYFDFFFVPYRLLWRYFPTAITQMGANAQSASSPTQHTTLSTNLPYINLSTLVKFTDQPGDNTPDSSLLCYSLNKGIVDAVGLPHAYQSAKLLSYLGYCFCDPQKFSDYRKAVADGAPLPANFKNFYAFDLKVSPFPLLAYQKIYYDFYRNSVWEKSQTYAFNCDYISSDDEMQIYRPPFFKDSSDWVRNSLITLRYANWNKDIFMGSLPSSQNGQESLAQIDTTSFEFDFSATGNVPEAKVFARNNTGTPYDMELHASFTDQQGLHGQGLSTTSGDVLPLGSKLRVEQRPVVVSGTKAFNELKGSLGILNLRKAQALQKWKEISQSDEGYKQQIYKHFGVNVPDSLSMQCTYIGGCTNNVDINEVVNQNLFGDGKGADASISGKGLGSGEDYCGEYEVKEHGIIMCIYHAIPLLDYENIGTDSQLTKIHPTDFPIPEFDSLGLTPLNHTCLDNSVGFSQVNNTHLYLAYTPRYIDFKSSVDLVNGAFLTTLRQWNAPITREFLSKLLADTGQSPTDTTSATINYKFFKVHPQVLNPIFGVSSEMKGWDSDQLLVNSYINVNAVRNLDYYGMPY